MGINAGRLNEVVKIYNVESTINQYGERVEDYVLTKSTRAKVEYNTGNRRNQNDEIVFDYQKTFNFRSYAPVCDTSHLEWQGKQYRVLSVEKRREYNDIIVVAELINE